MQCVYGYMVFLRQFFTFLLITQKSFNNYLLPKIFEGMCYLVPKSQKQILEDKHLFFGSLISEVWEFKIPKLGAEEMVQWLRATVCFLDNPNSGYSSTHGSLQPSVNLVLRYMSPSSGLYGNYMYIVPKHILAKHHVVKSLKWIIIIVNIFKTVYFYPSTDKYSLA